MSGLRQVSWSNSSLLINNKPFYFRGFGRHEDSNIRGKGADLPLFARDYNLIKWMGANSYRTSHYPYDDQLMDFADRNGIVIIDECPGVALDHFEAPLLAHHLAVMTELVARDKNHPSVVMWSVGNEPRSYRNQSGGQPSLGGHLSDAPRCAGEYFKQVAGHTRQLDPTRPVTLVCNAQWDQVSSPATQRGHVSRVTCHVSGPRQPTLRHRGHQPVLRVVQRPRTHRGHRAEALLRPRQLEAGPRWAGHPEAGTLSAVSLVAGKPVMLTEYGADTVAGLHMEPSMVFTEEYQVPRVTCPVLCCHCRLTCAG